MSKISDNENRKIETRTNILIFPAGAENRMDIYDSLRHNPGFDVYGASSKIDHAKYIYPENHYYIGDLNIADKGFIDRFNSLLSRFKIDFVIPTHDTVAAFLMKEEKAINAHILCSPYETARIAENKKMTAQALQNCPFCPKVYENIDKVTEYPVFLKPYIGAGSRGTHIVQDRQTLGQILCRNRDLLICEYLPGREYTVGCFTNKKGELLFAGPGTRERIIDGRSYHSERADVNGKFQKIAVELNSRFKFRGSWFFQVKEDKAGMLKLLEFSVRQIGEMALYRQLGVNFAAMSVMDAMGEDVKVIFNDRDLIVDLNFRNNYYFNFPYERVYIDSEDTLIVNGRINTFLLNYLYQCFNRGIKITLLAKKKGTYEDMVGKYPISERLFSEVLTVAEDRGVCDHITDPKAVYISSDWQERFRVKETCGIPVFDLDAVECLTGGRI